MTPPVLLLPSSDPSVLSSLSMDSFIRLGDTTRKARVQRLLLPPQNEGNLLGDLNRRSDLNLDIAVETQLDINHLLLLGLARGMKRSMDVLEREIKRMKEQTPAVDRGRILKKHLLA